MWLCVTTVKSCDEYNGTWMFRPGTFHSCVGGSCVAASRNVPGMHVSYWNPQMELFTNVSRKSKSSFSRSISPPVGRGATLLGVLLCAMGVTGATGVLVNSRTPS